MIQSTPGLPRLGWTDSAHATPTPRAVFFDAGLVLLGPDGDMLARAASAELGLELDAQRCVRAYRLAIHQRDQDGLSEAAFDFSAAWCAFAGVPAEMRAAVSALLGRLSSPEVDMWCAAEAGAAHTLDALRRRGVRVGIISNSHGGLASQFERAGFSRYVDCYVDSTLEGVAKPALAIFERALTRLGVAPAEAWYVGDDYLLDVVPARSLGFARVLHYDPLQLYSGGIHGLEQIVLQLDATDTLETQVKP